MTWPEVTSIVLYGISAIASLGTVVTGALSEKSSSSIFDGANGWETVFIGYVSFFLCRNIEEGRLANGERRAGMRRILTTHDRFYIAWTLSFVMFVISITWLPGLFVL